MKKLGISTDFMLTYLHRIGFNNLISLAELVSYFKGIFVPCVELYETMDFALNMFEIFDGIMKKKKTEYKDGMCRCIRAIDDTIFVALCVDPY